MTSPTLDRKIRLAEAAQRYYVDGWSQDRVAAHLDTSRSNVSRLLETARREGVIRFVVDHPLSRHDALEDALRRRFGVPGVRVVATADPSLELVGRMAAAWIEGAEFERLAIGWGRSVQEAIDHVAIDTPRDVEVVQIGGDLTLAPAASGHELVRRLASALGGRHRFLHAPALVASEAVAAELTADPLISAELELARTADAALVGIGRPDSGFAERAISESYAGDRDDAAGVVAARLIGDDGQELQGPLARRVIALTLDDLHAIPTVVAVASGAEKGRAVAAALRSGVVDLLVTDQPCAAAALDRREP